MDKMQQIKSYLNRGWGLSGRSSQIRQQKFRQESFPAGMDEKSGPGYGDGQDLLG